MYDLIDDIVAIMRGHQTFFMIPILVWSPYDKCIYMTYKLHVHAVYDRMYVMARPCQINSLFKFFVRGLVIMLFIIFGSFMKFWALAWVIIQIFLDFQR